jgi:hypothetical protein
MSIFSCLSKAESNVQTALKKEWDAIPQASKDEILIILKATNIIKANDTLNGDEIIALIEKETGKPFVDNWLTIVDKVAGSIGIEVPAGSTPSQTVTLIASALTPKSGDNWKDTVLHIAVYSLTNLIPGGTIVREIALPLIQWVFDNVFNKPATPVSA